MVARPNLGTILHFANTDLTCWRCALKLFRRYEPILQQPTVIVSGNPRTKGAQRASQDPSSTGTVATQLDSLSRPVRKDRTDSTDSLGPQQYVALREYLASTGRDPEYARSANPAHRIVRRRGCHFALRGRGRYYTTSAWRNTVSDVQATPPVDGSLTFNNFPPAKQKIRERLQLWQQQLESQVDPSSSITAKLTSFSEVNPRAAHNVVTQGAADGQRIDGDDEGEDFSSLDDSIHYLRPGDLVGLRRQGEPIVGVFIRRFFHQNQIYMMTGKWVHTHSRLAYFVAEQTIPPEDLDVILPYLPQQQIPANELDQLHAFGKVPREAGAKLIQKLLQFHNSTNQIIKEFAGRLNRIHELIAHPTKRSHATLHEIAMKVLKKESREALTTHMLWAVHSALVRNDYCAVVNLSHRSHFTFDIMSRADAISLENVRDWVREYQEGLATAHTQHLENPLPRFVRKCRALVRQSRKTRDAIKPCGIGPSSVRVIPKQPDLAVWKSSQSTWFDEDEAKILRFFHTWSTIGSFKLMACALLSAGSTILRAIGMYEDFELDKQVGFLLLKELGVIPPWLNRQQYNPQLPFPGHHVDALTDELDLQVKESVVGFQMEDCMKDVRRDWGDLEAFCIDDAGAHEIDDGLSLEEIDESSSWVHIHVANPSAFLSPSSAIARSAAHRVGSVYFPEGNFPMMPEEISHQFFSLGNNRPCITFSAKVTLTGDILDTQISHGVLRNVRHLTPDDVQRELGLEPESGEKPLNVTVGCRLPVTAAMPKTSPLSSSQRRLLRRLHQLSEARRQKQLRETGLDLNVSRKPEPKVYLGPGNMGMTKRHLQERTARRFEGDPIISVTSIVNSSKQPNSALPAHLMVAVMMVLAGEIGAAWCSKRNIPLIYRGTLRHPNPFESPELFRRKYLDPFTAEKKEIPSVLLGYYFKIVGAVINSSIPLRHVSLGAEAYAQLTSPLRRFADLMNQWQIESAIRFESQTGTSLIGSTDDSYLAFSRRETERLVQSLVIREAAIKKTMRRSDRHWLTQLIFRAFHYKEALLPESFNVVIRREVSDVTSIATMRDLELEVEVAKTEVSQREGGFQPEDIWEVKIRDVNCYIGLVIMEPIRLVERPNIPNGPWNYLP